MGKGEMAENILRGRLATGESIVFDLSKST